MKAKTHTSVVIRGSLTLEGFIVPEAAARAGAKLMIQRLLIDPTV